MVDFVKMYSIFDISQSNSLKRYQKFLRVCSFGCKNLLNFTCLTMKFHNLAPYPHLLIFLHKYKVDS